MRIGRRVGLLSLAVPFVILALHGCASNTTSTAATVGPSGGSLALAAQGVRLDVPAGALAQDTAVTLSATLSSGVLVVGIEPAGLALGQQGTLGVSFQRPVHISDVSEVQGTMSFPIGVDVRQETTSGAQLRLRLDHFAEIRVATEDETSDGGTRTCCGEGCEETNDGGHRDEGFWGHRQRPDGGFCFGWGDEQSDGGFCVDMDSEHTDGGHRDGGFWSHKEHSDGGFCFGRGDEQSDGGVCVDMDDEHGDDDQGRDGGSIASGGSCPSGFECDDGVCVAPGGNDEGHGQLCGGGHEGQGMADAGTCPMGTHCSEGRCKPDELADGGNP